MLSAGQQVGPYQVLAALGAGGMGEVYRARDVRLGRDVALKVIRSDKAADAERQRRFEAEARAAGALNHPNLLSVFDVGFADGQPYVVFELLEGESLATRLERGPLPARKAIEYAAQVCQGLGAVHARGIVHRDLKPANLFVTRDGHVKILDFGLAKLVQDAQPESSERTTLTQTQSGGLVGTLAYISPEQVRGQAADARSDIFALGTTLYEMVSGRSAFLRATTADTVSAILNHDPASLAPVPEPPPAGLEPLVRRCLEKDPDQRFQSARDLGFALSAIAASTASGATGRVGQPNRRPWPLVAGAVLVLGALLAVGLRSRPAPTLPAPSVAPFTTYPGAEYDPSFSPDGSQIAFAWQEPSSKGTHIYVKVVGSEKALQVTAEPGAITPAWSPDGRSIAFARMGRDGGVYVVPALGGAIRRLAEAPYDFPLETRVSWTPDAKHLAYTAGPPGLPWGIYVMDVTTLETKRLDPPDPTCPFWWMPAFSPDGTLLARFCFRSINLNDLFVGPASEATARQIAHVNGELSGFAWAGDGKSLVIGAEGTLSRVAATGGEPQKLPFGQDAGAPAISRDGRRLAYTQQTLNSNLWRVSLARTTREGGPPAAIAPSSRWTSGPHYSPDGRRLAFDSTRSGSREIWTSAADGANPRRQTSFGGPLTGSARFSPDGRWIALDSRARGHGDVYLLDTEGGAPRLLETGQGDTQVPFWSPDGKSIYFEAPVAGTRQIFVVARDGGKARQLTTRGGECPQAAPDGKRVYYWTNASGGALWSVAAGGGDERPVSGMPPVSHDTSTNWAVDSRGIYFTQAEPSPVAAFLDFATGRTRRVADLPGPPADWSGLAVSPDGHELVFTKLEPAISDIMLVENFR